MIMPGVQKPHWKPCAARKAACIGWTRRRGLAGAAWSREPLDRCDAAPLGAERRDQAAMHRLAVEMDRAGAAIAGIATLLDAEPAGLAQIGAQALPGPGRASCGKPLTVSLMGGSLGRDGPAPSPARPADLVGELPGHVAAPVRPAVHVVVVERLRDRIVDGLSQARPVGQPVEGEAERTPSQRP